MRGQSNRMSPILDVQALLRGSTNTYCAISQEGLVQNNKANAQAIANTTLGTSTPDGMLAGSVAAIVGSGIVGPATGATNGVYVGLVGVVQRNAAGEAFESTSSVASGSIAYLHGSNTLMAVPTYETHNVAGTAALDYSTAYGKPVYASQNGLLTIAEGLSSVGAGATVVGIIVETPSASNPVMVVQSRI